MMQRMNRGCGDQLTASVNTILEPSTEERVRRCCGLEAHRGEHIRAQQAFPETFSVPRLCEIHFEVARSREESIPLMGRCPDQETDRFSRTRRSLRPDTTYKATESEYSERSCTLTSPTSPHKQA
jgi:hypothetical protein